ncbi:uncharacterized protein [Ciconia boyciana]|uniref:uncharacterized protein isoform X2 n=1 Tax=Ciconia boyciana TaxID=52775 RepID=UPI003B9F952B
MRRVRAAQSDPITAAALMAPTLVGNSVSSMAEALQALGAGLCRSNWELETLSPRCRSDAGCDSMRGSLAPRRWEPRAPLQRDGDGRREQRAEPVLSSSDPRPGNPALGNGIISIDTPWPAKGAEELPEQCALGSPSRGKVPSSMFHGPAVQTRRAHPPGSTMRPRCPSDRPPLAQGAAPWVLTAERCPLGKLPLRRATASLPREPFAHSPAPLALSPITWACRESRAQRLRPKTSHGPRGRAGNHSHPMAASLCSKLFAPSLRGLLGLGLAGGSGRWRALRRAPCAGGRPALCWQGIFFSSSLFVKLPFS